MNLAGVLIDRWSRRQILVYSAGLRSLFVVLTAGLVGLVYGLIRAGEPTFCAESAQRGGVGLAEYDIPTLQRRRGH